MFSEPFLCRWVRSAMGHRGDYTYIGLSISTSQCIWSPFKVGITYKLFCKGSCLRKNIFRKPQQIKVLRDWRLLSVILLAMCPIVQRRKATNECDAEPVQSNSHPYNPLIICCSLSSDAGDPGLKSRPGDCYNTD